MKTRSSSTLALGALMLVVLAACNPETDTTVDDDDTNVSSTMNNDGPYLDDTDESEDEDEIEFNVGSAAASSTATTGDTSSVKEGAVRIIAVSVGDWYFKPEVINIKKGEKVQLQVTSDSGVHGFGVPELELNVRVEAGKTITIDIPTDKTGSFGVICTVPCGPGHREMKATIVITE